jgi:hypothetical protein
MTDTQTLNDILDDVKDGNPWQPIKTAPKDGTSIIGAFFGEKWSDNSRRNDVVRCWFEQEFNTFISSCREITMHNGYSFEDGKTSRLHSPVVEPITHWMPLDPPK